LFENDPDSKFSENKKKNQSQMLAALEERRSES